MLTLLHPTYTLTVEIQDRLSDAGQQLGGPGMYVTGGQMPTRKYATSGKTGCDEVLMAVKDALHQAGVWATVSLDRFEHKA